MSASPTGTVDTGAIGAGVRVRPMHMDDIGAVDLLSTRTFAHLSRRFGIPSGPPRDAAAARRSRGRLAHLLLTDPDLAVVAVDGRDRPIGCALGAQREGVWLLSLLVVAPSVQAAGVGRHLLQAVLPAPGAPGLIAASADPRAIRLYAGAGFAPRPTLGTRGPIRTVPPRPDEVRQGTPGDLDLCDELDRLNRGAWRRPDLELVLAHGGQLRILPDLGFSILHGNRLITVSARDTDVAAVLLQDFLAARTVGEEPDVLWLTQEHQWAVSQLVAAGLGLTSDGAVCVRPGTDLRASYLPTGAYL